MYGTIARTLEASSCFARDELSVSREQANCVWLVLLHQQVSFLPKEDIVFRQEERVPMAIRKSWDITDVNTLGMFYFRMSAIEQGDNIQILLITGDRGWPKSYAVEIRFFSIAYIGCPTYFEEEFLWRMATEEETSPIQAYTERLPGAKVYCLEEQLNKWIRRSPIKYFLAAANVELTLFDADPHEESSWGEKVESES